MRIPPLDFNAAAKPIASVKEVASSDGLGVVRNELGSVSSVGSDPSATFTEAIKKAVSEVNNLSNEADKLAINLASGDVEDVHKAMIAMQKAKLALDFTIQVRNKVIEAYQEIMRMQV